MSRYTGADGCSYSYASPISGGGPCFNDLADEDDSYLVRDYTVMRCDLPFDPDGEHGYYPAAREYWAFHDGDDSEVPSCVYIGTYEQQLDDSWKLSDSTSSWCDYCETGAVDVGSVDKLYPSEVVYECRKLVEKLTGENTND